MHWRGVEGGRLEARVLLVVRRRLQTPMELELDLGCPKSDS